ncbi:MAG: type II toxin-antitoxin system RelE/ParE family toxin, partial [Bacteroidota bacterium]
MPSETPQVIVEFTHEFKRSLRHLARRYRQIRSDLSPVITALEQGETPGDRVPGTGFLVFKVRVRNSDARRGKSGGYRVIYYVALPGRVVLVTIYSKSDQGDL